MSEDNPRSPHGMAHFVITRLRQQSRILEPFERANPFKRFTTPHAGELKMELCDLIGERNPERLVAHVRELYRRAGTGPEMTLEQFEVLLNSLPLVGRVGSEFAAELLSLVPDAVRQTIPKQPEPLIKRADLLDCAFSLAGHFGHHELAVQFACAFTELLAATTDDVGVFFMNRVAVPCVRCFRLLGLQDELNGLLQRLHAALLGQDSPNDWLTKFSGNQEQQLKALQALQPIAGGWLALGRSDEADPILDAARIELLSPGGKPRMTQEYTRLATAYIAAVGMGPAESGFLRLAELFRTIQPAKIVNCFVTAPFYSRLHLDVAENVVLAVLQILSFAPLPASR